MLEENGTEEAPRLAARLTSLCTLMIVASGLLISAWALHNWWVFIAYLLLGVVLGRYTFDRDWRYIPFIGDAVFAALWGPIAISWTVLLLLAAAGGGVDREVIFQISLANFRFDRLHPETQELA